MDDFLGIMLLPFLACVILTGMHSYLGFHVIEREVIFVDLALAQLAALGATFGYFLGLGLHSWGSYFCSFSFAIVGAAVFALTRFRTPVVPQEAIIGVVYAVGAALAVLLLSKMPEGGEELRNLLVGHLLFIDQHELLKMLFLYSLVALIHWHYREKFFLISVDHQSAFQQGLSVRLWDFVFYASFALVVTSSVEIAGVLLVFAFLIVPAVCAKYISSDMRARLFWGWGVSILTSIVGLVLSFWQDLPTGAAIVCVFGASLLLCSIYRMLYLHSRI